MESLAYMPIKTWARLACILCLAAACSVPTQRQQYQVGGKAVSEEAYRAARFYNDALPLIDANRLTEARVKLTAAVRLAPDFHDAHYNLGLVLLRLQREQDALEHFKTVVVAKANVPMAWVSLSAIYLNTGKHNEALATLNDAISRFPATTWQQIPEFYNNFGTALGKIGHMDEGIEQLKLGLRADPKLPFIWKNLGTFYQANGKLRDSIEHYKEFIKRFPNDPDVPVIVDAISIMEAELREASTIQARNDDYHAEVTKHQPKTWPRESMPLRVHIRSGEGVPGFEPRFMEILKTAFQDWVSASEGKVSIHFVDHPDADIECLWISDSSQLQNRAEGGEAQIYFQENGLIGRATVIILTIPMNRMSPITDNRIRFVALHEAGHALGLLGHSPNPKDVMFFATGIADVKPDLSERDRKTLVRLYSHQ